MESRAPFATGLGIGAVLMFWLDPERGRRRRGLVRDSAIHAARVSRNAIGATGRDDGPQNSISILRLCHHVLRPTRAADCRRRQTPLVCQAPSHCNTASITHDIRTALQTARFGPLESNSAQHSKSVSPRAHSVTVHSGDVGTVLELQSRKVVRRIVDKRNFRRIVLQSSFDVPRSRGAEKFNGFTAR
jgi:hypothetical protein